MVAILGDAQIAGHHAFDGAVFQDQLMRRKTGIDFHAQAFRLTAKPFAQIGKADDVIAPVAHQRREQKMRQGKRAGPGEEAEAVFGHRVSTGAPFSFHRGSVR
jgi:hypothetical protein